MKTLLSLAVLVLTSAQALAGQDQTLTCVVPGEIDTRIQKITIQDDYRNHDLTVRTAYTMVNDSPAEAVEKSNNSSIDADEIFLFEETATNKPVRHYLEREKSDRYNYFTIASYRNGSLIKRTDAFYCWYRE